MKLKLISDIHIEFHQDKGTSLIQEIMEGEFDILVLAGDIGNANTFPDTLRQFNSFGKPIVYVLGNHEAYHSSLTSNRENIAKLTTELPNLHHLENSATEILGQRFIGCTLWYPHPCNLDSDAWMSDFFHIGDNHRIHETAMASAAYLRENVTKSDIVVTHFLPHAKSIHPQYKGDKTNRYFLHNQDKVISKKQPKLWFHGHTHKSMDYTIDNTRVVCNPFGYINGAFDEPNPEFKANLIIEI